MKWANLLRLAVAGAAILGASGCGNLFLELADTSTDQALMYQAKKDLGTGLWTQAIADIGKMTAATQAARATQDLLASAYAGRCGLDAITISLKLSGLGSAKFFGFVYNIGLGATASEITDCLTSETILLGVGGTGALRTGDENLLLAFMELVKMGSILALKSDPNATGTPLWSRAGTNHPCDASGGTAPTQLTNADVDNMLIGFDIFIDSITAAGSNGAASVVTVVNALKAFLPGGFAGFFTVYTASGSNGNYRQLMRAMIEEQNSIGLAIDTVDTLNGTYLAWCPNAN
jgi:hypothetical protein